MFPSRDTGLPRAPDSALLRRWRVRSFTGCRGISPPAHPVSALPRHLPPGGLACEPFRVEPAVTGLDWPFTPSPGSGERFALQHPFGPPPLVRVASPCPGLDRPASGLTAVTPGPFGPRPSHIKCCGHVGFPTTPGRKPLSLATAVNSLARVSTRTAGRRSPPLILPRRRGFFWGGSSLSRPAGLSPPGFRLFSLPVRGSFQLSLTVLVRYRSWDVFRIGSRCLPDSRPISKGRYSGWQRSLPGLRLRGFHPLRRRHSSRTSASPGREHMLPSCNTTSPLYRYRGFGLSCAAFGRPYSRHRFCFLFLPLLRCFSSGGSPSLRSDPPYGGPGGPIRRSRALRLHAPHPGLSQLATAFVGAQAEPSTGRLKPWTSSLQLVSTNYLCT